MKFTVGKKMRTCLSLALAIFLSSAPLSGITLSAEENSELSSGAGTVKVYQTVKGGVMDARLDDLTFVPYDNTQDTKKTLRVFVGDTKQEILGLGGAMTEAAAYNLSLLTEEQRQAVYDAYFSADGANYALVRSTIGSADFSVKSYSYNDTEAPDPQLENFSIAKDYDYVIPALKRIQTYRNDIKFFAAPWAPPAWMKKSNVRRGQTGTAALSLIDNSLNPDYFDAYARYFVKYLQAYKQEGIDIFSLSIQNEAQNNPKWEACTWSIPATVEFIANHLGPALEQNGLDPELLIWDWDKGNDSMHGDGFIKYNLGVLSDARAKKYIDGIAFHWYAGDIWHEIAGKPMWSKDFYSLDTVKQQHPDIKLYATEACQEKGPWLYSFDPADRYIYDILNDFEHGVSSWIDWNLLLDVDGGPTQGVVNKCHAPIMMDADKNLIFNPAYYILKRLSSEIQPGSFALRSEMNFDGVEKTAIKKANGEVAVFLGNIKNYEQTVNVVLGDSMVQVKLPAHSMTTLVCAAPAALSLFKPDSAYSDSYERNPFKNYRAPQAIDADLNSRWASAWRDNESITFVMNSECLLSGINLLFECGQDAEFEIQVSADGVNFETVAHVAKNTYRQQRNVNLTFPQVRAKYVKMQGIARNNRYGYSLYDVNLIGSQA